MTFAEQMLPEFDQEMANTRRVLELVPAAQLSWQAHPELHTVGWNANHLAEIPGWVPDTMSGTEFDFNPVGGPAYASPNHTSTADILELFDRGVAAARQAIAAANDADFAVRWSLLDAGVTLATMTRGEVIRMWVINHMIHHRAMLIVYLRLLGVQVPGMYGP